MLTQKARKYVRIITNRDATLHPCTCTWMIFEYKITVKDVWNRIAHRPLFHSFRQPHNSLSVMNMNIAHSLIKFPQDLITKFPSPKRIPSHTSEQCTRLLPRTKAPKHSGKGVYMANRIPVKMFLVRYDSLSVLPLR